LICFSWAKNLTFGYGEKTLFQGANFSVSKGQKVGLVGLNGAGKTTLFNLICQKEFPQEGEIEVLGKIGFVPQEVKFDPEVENARSVRDYLMTGFKQDFELKEMLSRLELTDLSLESLPRNLSGGQKTKLALCRALLSEPEILLLDEPTNFMDKEGKKWVMNFLSHYAKTLIVISHDLKLMDRAIDRVLYINEHTKKIEEYKGNYSKFLKLKKEKEDLFKKNFVAQEKQIKRMQEGVKKLYRHTSKKGVKDEAFFTRAVAGGRAAD
ncbi:MAG: ATP-binding cassette domain-containing protein, partial [Patescibacteria group bacterium]|nr:ATP-binding cassette domain-containing protein [Patescibacteria group bacterium]